MRSPPAPPAKAPAFVSCVQTIERLWARLKEWRAIATRYEKTASSFMGVLCLPLSTGSSPDRYPHFSFVAKDLISLADPAALGGRARERTCSMKPVIGPRPSSGRPTLGMQDAPTVS